MGRSRGGFGTRLHLAGAGLGNPVDFILTGGQEADISQGKASIEGHDCDLVIADKGYDGNEFVKAIEASGAEYDKILYKERHLAERFLDQIKQNRRVATRYHKTARNFLGFVHVAAIMILLR